MHLSKWTVLDFTFVLTILISMILAVRKGLARELISLAALIGGFILAVCYYPAVGSWFTEYTRTEGIAHLIAFLFIFIGTLAVGAVAAYMVNRFVKSASLQWVDRILGALYGFVRGWAISSIIVLALIAFPIRHDTLARSYLAPFLLAGARGAVLLVPRTLKDQFYAEYQKVLQAWNQNRNTA